MHLKLAKYTKRPLPKILTHWKDTPFSFVLLLICSPCFGQKKDSIPEKINAYVADKFPSTRVLNIEHDQLASHKFNSSLLNGPETSGEITNMYQTKVNLNPSFIKKRRWSLSGSFNYRYIGATTAYTNPTDQLKTIVKTNYHYHTSSLNFAYFSKLLDKMVVYSGSAVVDGSEKNFERVKGLLTATMILKANLKTKMTIGLVGIVDPSTQIPVIPTFSFEHKFKGDWIIDIVLPQRLLFKKEIFGNGRLSLGSELDGTGIYLYQFNRSSGTHEFRQVEINTGAIYEHYFGGSFIGTVKTGLKNVTSGRVFEKSKSFDNYVFEAKPNGAMYLNLGISFNPFAKSKK
ncbi:hypothetical protein [Pedobacter sp. ASV28]|uniref:hypothetical protein n=1 Tax=Pedobacter sp. ASV28 TaxID=2795123 RepID=UPI0018EB9EC6|nr:hypothetical protein [Pedobacter sp. ASV28]